MCRSRAGGFCGTEDLLRDAVFTHWRRPRSSSPLTGHYWNASSTGAGVPFLCCWNQIVILFCIKYVLTFLNNVWFVWKTNNNSQQTPIQSCVQRGASIASLPPTFYQLIKNCPLLCCIVKCLIQTLINTIFEFWISKTVKHYLKIIWQERSLTGVVGQRHHRFSY